MCETFGQLENSAKKIGSDDNPVDGGESCPSWELTVVVKSVVDTWPTERICVKVLKLDGDHELSDRWTQMTSTTAPAVIYSGRNAQTYKISGNIDDFKWTFTSDEVTSVDGSDNKTINLNVEPQRWNAYRLVNNADKKQIDGAQIKVSLPGEKTDTIKPTGIGQTPSQSEKEMVLFSRMGNSKITEISHEEVWEFVEISGT